MRWPWWAALLCCAGMAHAESLAYFECARISYVSDDCAQLDLPDLEQPQVVPQALPPLFTPETVARDTPPLMLAVLNDPSPANIERYLAWNTLRMERAMQVERLLQRAKKGGRP